MLAALAAPLLAGCGDHGGPAKTDLPPLPKIERQDTPAAREVRAMLQDAGSGDDKKWSAALSSVTNLTENAVQGLADIVDSLSGGNSHQQVVACLMLKKLGPPAAAAAPALQRLYQSPQEALQVNALIASEAIAPQIPWPWKRIVAENIVVPNLSQMSSLYAMSEMLKGVKSAVLTSHEMIMGDKFESHASVRTMTARYGSPDRWEEGSSAREMGPCLLLRRTDSHDDWEIASSASVTNEGRHFCTYGPLRFEASADRKQVRANSLAMPDLLWLMLAKPSVGKVPGLDFSGIPDLVLPASGSAADKPVAK